MSTPPLVLSLWSRRIICYWGWVQKPPAMILIQHTSIPNALLKEQTERYRRARGERPARMIVIAHRGVASEGILDYAYFSLFSGALAQFAAVLPFLMMII